MWVKIYAFYDELEDKIKNIFKGFNLQQFLWVKIYAFYDELEHKIKNIFKGFTCKITSVININLQECWFPY